MFENRRKLKRIEEEKKKLEKLKTELLFIKNNLEDKMSKIDVSDLYVWRENGLSSIVKLTVKNFRGFNGYGKEKNGFESTLTDIFTNKIIYTKRSIELINPVQLVNGHYAYLNPIYKFDNNILAYADKKVPLYVLQQLYYRLNGVNINEHINKYKIKI